MKLRLPAIKAAALAAPVLALGIAGSAFAANAQRAAPAARAATTQAAPAGMVVFDCPGDKGPSVKPKDFILTCADANDDLGHLSWKSWSSLGAYATGEREINTCTPNCAEGHFRDYPVLVILWGSSAVKGHPAQRAYTEMTTVFTGQRPRLFSGQPYPAVQTTKLLTSASA